MEENGKVLRKEKPIPSGRLQSLKLPRDLTLGMSAKPKKQYTPNLNVIRNKDKNKEFLKQLQRKRKDNPIAERKPRNHNKPQYIQSLGIFSDGSAEIKRTSSYTPGYGGSREGGGGGASQMVVPTITGKAWNVNKNTEEGILEDLMNYDIDSDEDENSPLDLVPLPWGCEQTVCDGNINRVTIKKEVDPLIEMKTQSLIPEPFNSETFNDENTSLALVKLPDSFAGKGLSDDPNVKKLFDYPLSGMLEGQIGKLVIRKSGKMEVHIGSVRYELTPDQTYESKQELATIGSDNGNNSIAVLGKVQQNFVMFPDYDKLITTKK